MKKCFLMGLFLILIGCTTMPDAPFKREASVACLLSNYYNNQELFIYYTSEGSHDINDRDSLFVKDAHVTVSSASQLIPFELNTSVKNHDNGRPGWVFKDTGQKLKLVAAKNYTLDIETEVGKISGETTMPDSFNILFPEQGARYNGTNFPDGRWEAHAGAAIYIVEHVMPPDTFISSRTGKQEIYRHLINGSTTGSSYTFNEKGNLKKGNHLLRVIACDINFKRHLFDGVDISGVKGGYGYFGSAFVDTVSFYIQ